MVNEVKAGLIVLLGKVLQVVEKAVRNGVQCLGGSSERMLGILPA